MNPPSKIVHSVALQDDLRSRIDTLVAMPRANTLHHAHATCLDSRLWWIKSCNPPHDSALMILDARSQPAEKRSYLRWLRSNDLTRWLPVVVVCSDKQKIDTASFYQLKSNSVISVTVNHDQLDDVVLHLFQFWRFASSVAPPSSESLKPNFFRRHSQSISSGSTPGDGSGPSLGSPLLQTQVK